MKYRDPNASLPEIPVIDCDEGGATRLFDLTAAGAHRLADVAKRSYTAPVVAFLDWRSRQWVERNDSPYVPEIEHIAQQLSGAGAYALNCSYEWACTTAAVGPQVMRALDWRLDGMGPEIVVARHRSPAGSWLNVTWPGFVGVLTALAPGRFAAALNQAPLRRRTYLFPLDWLIDRIKVNHTSAMLPTHLLRLVFETCSTFEEAVEVLRETPIAMPCLFAISGAKGEACVIERQEKKAFVFEGNEVMANHWANSQWRRGRSRGIDSEKRWHALRATTQHSDLGQGFGWLRPPVLNRLTRLAAVMNAATGALSVVGLEAKGTTAVPVTKTLHLGVPLSVKK
ncbi:MAG TPA: carcinine hydrolase/isopenicillin-N N-acyltransferase family protein [Dongiaceae bacterium]|nr:carcinine hydrolase/isopenicillin-N N-acyltransferase family protein [Dongiaceae bacterium]